MKITKASTLFNKLKNLRGLIIYYYKLIILTILYNPNKRFLN